MPPRWGIVVSMSTKYRETYHFESGLEQAVIDLVRVGSTGFASGVRQLASRLVRAVPPGVQDPEAFRQLLHDALSDVGAQTGLRFASGELPTADDGGLPLATVDPTPDGDGLVLPDLPMAELNEVVTERLRFEELAREGVSPTRTLLLSGPPGVGKTMAARWLADRIGVPLVALDLSAISSSYLGNSGRNIRAVLDYAKSGSCVLLLDEFDAVAKRRDDDSDIGELKRVVNVVLVELDRWPDTSLLVAATNHLHLLDPAIGRRFDKALELPLPGGAERLAILRHLAAGSDLADDRVLQLVSDVTDFMTGSDIARLWNTARRRHVLRQSGTAEELLAEVIWRVREPVEARDRAWLAAADHLQMSNRQIAIHAGVSHPTVSSALKRARGNHGAV